MKRFKTYLKEDVGTEKFLHLDHLEDLPILKGRDGITKVLGILGSIINQMHQVEGDDIDVTTKWDGAPNLTMGINPENGKFFVGTKSIFNKLTPKINYTNEDIEKNHEQPELQKKLKYALKHFKDLGIKNILSGDLMFIDSDVDSKTVDGVDSYTFRPNTITYVIDKDSELGKKIKKAKIGIIFHTEYKGSTMKNLTGNLHVSLRRLNRSPLVWFENANFQMVAPEVPNGDTLKKMHKEMDNLRFLFDQLDKNLLDKLDNDNELRDVFSQFINFLVRTDNNKAKPVDKLKMFGQYLKDKYVGQASTKKTDASKLRTDTKMKYVQSVVKSHIKTFVTLLKIHGVIADIKMNILDNIKQKDEMKSYIEKDDKMTRTKPEGFVAVSDSYGTVKLIDRSTFSKENFNLPKNWKKE